MKSSISMVKPMASMTMPIRIGTWEAIKVNGAGINRQTTAATAIHNGNNLVNP